MDRVGILCDKDRDMMRAFSRRSLDRIQSHSLLSRSLSLFTAYLDANVKKEIEKDRLVIREAADLFSAGKPACDLDLENIFEKTKVMDKAFLDSLLIPSFAYKMHYGDFADVRIQRIWRIGKTTHTLLSNWPEPSFFVDAVRNAYTGEAFKSNLVEILHLYSTETRMLSRSLRLPPPFGKALTAYTETLFQAMEETTTEITDQYTKKIFGNTIVYA